MFEYFAVPLQIGGHERSTRSASDKLDRRIHIAHLARCVCGLHAIFHCWHVANLPRTVHFVAQAPVLYFVGFGYSVLPAQITPACPFLYVAVLDEGGGLFRRSCAQI